MRNQNGTSKYLKGDNMLCVVFTKNYLTLLGQKKLILISNIKKTLLGYKIVSTYSAFRSWVDQRNINAWIII